MPKRCAIWPTSKTCFPPIMTWVSESHTANPNLFGWAAGAVGLAFDARAAGAGAGRAPRALGWGRAGAWAAAFRPAKRRCLAGKGLAWRQGGRGTRNAARRWAALPRAGSPGPARMRCLRAGSSRWRRRPEKRRSLA
eukprot:2488320-Pleurochrysis_carterae.AAC.1